MDTVLKVDNIEKFYGSKGNITKAINGISFEVKSGEYIGIIMNDKFFIGDKLALEDAMYTKGNHSGLDKFETNIPLIVI